MHSAPTVIVVDTTQDRGASLEGPPSPPPWLFDSVLTQIHRVMAAGLPLALVASTSTLKGVAPHLGSMPITLAAQDNPLMQDDMAGALRTGVQACASSRGWILLPSDVPMLHPGTLKELSGSLMQHPVAYITHRGRVGMPMGFGQELYSELVRIDSNRALQRLVNRYPSRALDLDAHELEAGDRPIDARNLRQRAGAFKG